jgi:hypothetical protein
MAMVPAGVLVALAIRAYRYSGTLVEPWAKERQLEVDSTNRAMVAWYLRTSRTLRLLGVLAGFVLAPLVALALGDESLGGGYTWMAAIGGYLGGVAYAEVALRRPSGTHASVRRRELSDYLSPWARRGQRRTAVVAAGFAGLAVVVPMREPQLVSLGGRVAVLLAVPAVLLGIEALQRWLVRRPQPVVSRSLLEADDAIRRQSVHSIAGAGMGLLWLLAGTAMWTLAASDVQVLRWTMWIGGLLAWGVAIGSCTHYDSGIWQRRTTPAPVSPSC